MAASWTMVMPPGTFQGVSQIASTQHHPWSARTDLRREVCVCVCVSSQVPRALSELLGACGDLRGGSGRLGLSAWLLLLVDPSAGLRLHGTNCREGP